MAACGERGEKAVGGVRRDIAIERSVRMAFDVDIMMASEADGSRTGASSFEIAGVLTSMPSPYILLRA